MPTRSLVTRAVLGAAPVVGALGTLACLRPWLGWSLPFETWAAPASVPVGNFPVGQMSPVTGALLLGAAVAYGLGSFAPEPRKRSRKFAALLGVTVLLAGTVVAASYLVGRPLLYGSSVIPIALWTAICFVFLGGALLGDAANSGKQPADEALFPAQGARPTNPLPALIAVAFALGISLLTAMYLRHQHQQDRDDARRMLAAIGDLKLAQVSNWREERLNDARFFAQADFVSRDVQMFLEHPASGQARNRLTHWLNLLKGGKRYSIVAVFDSNAVLRLALPEQTNANFVAPTALMAEALNSNQVVMSDLHRGDDAGEVHLEIAFPVAAPVSGSNLVFPRVQSPPIGVVLLRLDPRQFLFPFLQSWPTPSRTAETVLFRREGNEVVFLNEMRHRTNSALNVRFPIATNSNLPAVKAVLGQLGEIEGRDYRDVPVLTSIRSVPDSTWFLIAKVDREEIYAPLKRQAWLTLVLTAVLASAAGLAVGFAAKRREANLALERLALTQRVEHLMKSANDAIMLADEQQVILEANDRALELYGYSLAELQATPLAELRAPEARAGFAERERELLANGQAVFETLHRRKDGSVFPVEISSRLIEIGGKGYKLGIFRDITQRKAHEREIERLNRLYATLSQVNQSITRVRSREELFAEICRIGVEFGGFKIVWVGGLEPATKAVKVLARAGESLGYLDQIKVMADDSPEGHGPVGLCIRQGKPVVFNAFLRDERAAPWREAAAAHGLRAVAALPIRFEGEVCGAFTVYAGEPGIFQDKESALLEEMALDISFALDHLAHEEKRRQAEAALRASEDRLEFALQVSATGAWELNLLDHTAHRTLQHDRIFGYPTLQPAWTYEMFLEHVLPEDRAEVDRRFRQAMAEKADWNFECRIRRCDGEVRWISASGRHRLDEHGIAQTMSGIVQDITERKQAEGKLQLWAGAFERAHFALAIADATTNTFIAVNPTFARERGYRPEELAGRSVLTVYPPELAESIKGRLQDLDHASHGVFESEHVCKDGRRFPVLLDVTVIKSADGKPATRLSYALDITERKQAQAAIQQSEEFKQSILDSVASHIAVLDRQGVIVAVNERWRRFAEENRTPSGTPPQNVGLGVNYLEICRQSKDVDAAEGKVAGDGIRAVLAGQLPNFTMEYACHAPHQARWFSLTVTPLGPDHHSVVVAHLNITQRKQAEIVREALLTLGTKLSTVHNPTEAARTIFATSDTLWQWDAGTLDICPPGGRQMQPVLYVDVLGGKRCEIPQDGNYRETTLRFRQVVTQGPELILRQPAQLKESDSLMIGDTTRLSASIMCAPLRSQGRPVGVLSIQSYTPNAYTQEDLRTLQALADHCGGALERIQVEAAMRASEEQFRAMFELASIGMAQADPQTGRLQRVNQKLCAITGYPAGELLQMRFSDFTHPEDRAKDWAAFQRVARGEVADYHLEKRYLRKDGVVAWVNVNVSAVRDASGQMIRSMAAIEDITERKQAEESLRESERTLRRERALLRALLDSIPDLIFFKDKNSVYLGCNQAFEHYSGLASADLIGKNDLELTTPEVAERYRQKDREVFAASAPLVTEEWIPFHDGGGGMFETLKTQYLDVDGEVLGLIGISRDITDRKRMEQALHHRLELQNQLAQIAATVPGMIYSFRLRPDGSVAVPFASAAIDHIFGLQLEQVRDDAGPILAMIHPDDLARVNETIAASARTLTPWRSEFRACHTRRGELWLEGHSVPALEADGSVLWNGFIQDISERKKAEAALLESETRLQLALVASHMGVWEWDLQTNAVFWSPDCFSIVGVAPQSGSLTLEDFLQLVHPEDRALVQQASGQAIADHKPFHAEFRLLRPDGSLRWLVDDARASYDAHGKPLRLVGTVQDITARKLAEEEVRKLSRAMEQSPASIVITDTAGRIEYVNPKFTEVTGYSLAEVRGQNPRLLKSGATSAEAYRKLWQTILAGQEWRGEFHNRKKNGELFWEAVSISPILDAAGRSTHFVAVKEDITERKRLEAQFRQAQKMEAIGQLAGGVAHDFNNILAATLMQLSLLQQTAELDAETRASLKELETESQRAASLTRQLLMFSRRSVLQVKALDVNEVVEHLLKMLRRLIGEQITLEWQSSAQLPAVSADAGMLEQVIMNLVVNARDAMPHGGRITLSTSLVTLDADAARTMPEARPGAFVCLAVTDGGCGMDEATLKRIFEPFFTTKEAGKGTGLGLATVYGIASQHQGWVAVESAIGQGSTFRVFLPALARAASDPTARPEAQPLPGGKETILLVEDEVSVRKTVGSFLRLRGYRVLEATNGMDALGLWTSHGSKIDLLFTDMVMPGGVTGLSLARKLRGAKPDLKVLISSGYSADLVQQSDLASQGIHFLAKPSSANDLAAAIRRCLDQPVV